MFCLPLQQLSRWCICISHLIVLNMRFKQFENCCSDWNAVKREKIGCIRLHIINQCGYAIGQSQLRILLRLANMFEIKWIELSGYVRFYLYTLLGQASYFIYKIWMVLIDILLTCLCPVFVYTLDPYGRNHSSLSPLCFSFLLYTGDTLVLWRLDYMWWCEVRALLLFVQVRSCIWWNQYLCKRRRCIY